MSAVRTETLAKVVIRQNPVQRLCELVDVAGVDQQALSAVLDELRDPTNASSNDGDARTHGFKQDNGHVVTHTREREDRRRPQLSEEPIVIQLANEVDGIFNTQLPRESEKLVPPRACATDHEPGPYAARETRIGSQQDIMTLRRDKSSSAQYFSLDSGTFVPRPGIVDAIRDDDASIWSNTIRCIQIR